MRRTKLLGAILLPLALLAAGPGLGQPARSKSPIAPPVFFSDTQRADLRRISTYLNTLKSVQGHFLQIDAKGRTDRGEFYIKKPGRVRFEYAKPNPNLIIADGTTVAIENSSLKTTDRYPLLSSPLRLLLSDNVDLNSDSRITAVTKEQGALTVTASENSGPAPGRITLTLADSGSGLELRQWEVVDAQGTRTMVAINDMRQVADIPARLFVIEDLSPFKKSR
jgi:outer membrane lipoprotein-sorting protein